jgi:hypothetical protein
MKNYTFLFLISFLVILNSCGIKSKELGEDNLIGTTFIEEKFNVKLSFKDSTSMDIISNDTIYTGSYSYNNKTKSGRIKSYDRKFQFNYSFILNDSKIKGNFETFTYSDSLSVIKYEPQGLESNNIAINTCKSLDGEYQIRVYSILNSKIVTFTLKENKSDYYDGEVIMEQPNLKTNGQWIFEKTKGYYRKIYEEVEIELFNENGNRINILKLRIDRDSNGCIKQLSSGNNSPLIKS